MKNVLTHKRAVVAGALWLGALLFHPIPLDAQEKRGDVMAALAQAEAAFQTDPSDPEGRLRYGELLYKSGEFWRADDVISPLAESDALSPEQRSVAAKLAYLIGDYDRAEQLYQRVIEENAGNLTGQVMGMVNLMFVYYQQNAFGKAAEISFPEGVVLPTVDVLRVFDEAPYQPEWHGEERTSVVEFMVTDPLPLFTIEVDDRSLNVVFDTGADMLILDTEIAEELGVEWVTRATGTFGGGLQAEFGMGKVDRLKVGQVTLHHVPVMILPTQRFSSAFSDGEYSIDGIIGTQLMRQFLGTVDYRAERLVLRERTAENADALRQDLGDRIAAEIPFVLDLSHLMLVRGRLNDKEGLTFFVDSGLASEAVLTAPIETLEYLGIPEPETTIDEDEIGGAGGVYASGLFDLQTVGLGELVQHDVKGEYGSFPPGSYSARGYIQDALISHQFLRQYASWTLDFDSMTYLFER